MKQKRTAFEKALGEAVDEGLLILGESGREATYFRLQKSYALKKEDIPDNPETFVDYLEKIFGLGAKVIEKAIIKSLYRKLGLEYREKKVFDFMEYLNEAKMRLGRMKLKASI